MADKGGLIGIFFMAFTLALVSFSCTGPIIGTAIVQAATKGEYLGPFLVMLGFSTGLALPSLQGYSQQRDWLCHLDCLQHFQLG